MTVMGISVYPDMRPLEEIVEYLKLASKYGYTRVFTSMFSVEGTKDEVLGYFLRLDDAAHACGMVVSLDINPDCMQRMGATPSDLSAFAGIHADILRMDGAYGEDDNVAMLNNPYGLRIEYNASSLAPDAIAALVARGVDKDRILACHNFYPQPYSGFRWDKFCSVNERLSNLGIRIGAFVSSQAAQTHGVWDAQYGLPTVERLRHYPADLQARIIAAAGITDVFFGNAYATQQELAQVQQALAPVKPTYVSEALERSLKDSPFMDYESSLKRVRKVRVEPLYDLTDVERDILFSFFPHMDMGDSSEAIWRSRMPRTCYRDKSIAPRRYVGDSFRRGDVVMVNDNYRHYAGELQVVLEPVANDGMRNHVARMDEQELTMFDVINDGDIVVFLPIRG